MAARSPLITVMINAALKTARGLKRDFGEVENLQVSQKGPADFVSTADLKAEQTLIEELRRARPHFGFLLEESGELPGTDSSNRWIVDPLDGTTNFLHGIPHFAISIALERDGQPFAGVIYDPSRDEIYWAEKGIGAFMVGAYTSERRLRVSARRNVAEALIATGMPYKGRASHPEYPAMLGAVEEASAGVRRVGSAALDLAYVAAGRYDGYWEFALSPWDIAAGVLIVREAGGLVTEVDGGPNMMQSGDILATNGRLYEALRALLDSAAGATPALPAAAL
jgi:myo-inositol-1(or 4)-monophosphatase